MPSQFANLPMFKSLVQADGWCVMCVHVQPGHYSCIYHPAGGPGIQVAAAALCMGPALHHQPQAVPSCRPQRCQGIQRSAQGDTCTPLHTHWTPPGHPLPSLGHVKCKHQVMPRPVKASLHSHHLGSNACWNFNSV